MVASLIRLSLTLQANQLKRSVWAIVGTVFAGLYGLWIFGMGMVALVSLGGSPDLQLRTAVLVLIGSVLMAARPLWSSRRTSRPTWPGP